MSPLNPMAKLFASWYQPVHVNEPASPTEVSSQSTKKQQSKFPFKKFKSVSNHLKSGGEERQKQQQEQLASKSAHEVSSSQASELDSITVLSRAIPEYNLSQFRFGGVSSESLSVHTSDKAELTNSGDEWSLMIISNQPLTSQTRVENIFKFPSSTCCCENPLDRILMLADRVKDKEHVCLNRDGFQASDSISNSSSFSSSEGVENSNTCCKEMVDTTPTFLEEDLPIDKLFKSRTRVSKKRHTSKRKNSSSLKEIDFFTFLSMEGNNIQGRRPSVVIVQTAVDRRVSIVEEYVD
ncbi:hypothetical protein C9374_008018 [Naegleria lovaniensis]|uniref:Uncharacterized protein n=1 Tax=Naegleria lovaniensis TaxID=51637 RepID=A0AA88GKQ1_NAELO|nr:uncharacterized protein C9374_008018 [Naegleria lovaniensis]KAG2378870.1 hypothetical protein C9374_008018 [Naegleria lovaniensis]